MADKKNIIIDFGKISTPYCGLAEVALNFSEELNRLAPPDFNFSFIVPRALRSEFDRRVQTKNVLTPNYKGFNRLLYYLTRQTNLLCKIPKHDIYHYLHFYSPWGPSHLDKNKTLLTIHDFHALERKRAVKRLYKCLDKVAHIAFISNFAFQEYKKHIKPCNHSTRVIVNGVRVPHLDKFDKLNIPDEYGEFLFTLGGLKRKNIHSLLGMLQKSRKQQLCKNLKLLVAGSIKEKYKNELTAETIDRGIENDVIFLGPVTEQVKYAYIRACRAFVFPSLQEGFGLPVIEALHFGKPVFCSNRTSLPEVGGDQVYYWEKFDSDYMAEILVDGLVDNDNTLKESVVKRQQYARTFDWEVNVRSYLDVYKSIL